MEEQLHCIKCGVQVQEGNQYCEKCSLEMEVKNVETQIEM